MNIEHKAHTLAYLMSQIETNNLVLPAFQRGVVWDEDGVRRLMASFLTGIPIGSILVLTGPSSMFAGRRICLDEMAPASPGNCEFLLDGQQRLTALRTSLYDLFESRATWEATWRSAFDIAKLRWFLRLRPVERIGEDSETDSIDLFGYRTLTAPDLTSMQSDELMECLESRRLHVGAKSHKDWYHPARQLKDGDQPFSDAERDYKLATDAAADGLIPLFQLGRLRQGWLPKAIEQIAKIRRGELEAQIKGVAQGGRAPPAYHDELVSALALNRPDVRKCIERAFPTDGEGDAESLAGFLEALQSLQNGWVADLTRQLFSILQTPIPVILCPGDEGRAIATYEAINRGGTALENYDYIVAKAAMNGGDVQLTQNVLQVLKTPVASQSAGLIPQQYGANSDWVATSMATIHDKGPSKEVKNWFLAMLSVMRHQGSSQPSVELIKRKAMLAIDGEGIRNGWQPCMAALIRALKFFQFRSGIRTVNDIQYQLMLLPVAFALQADDAWRDETVLDRIEYWYWSSLLSGHYQSDQNRRAMEDLTALNRWVNAGEPNPFTDRERTVFAKDGYSDRNTLLRKPLQGNTQVEAVPGAVHRAILQYVLSTCPKDFLQKDGKDVRLTAWDAASDDSALSLQDHHVIPLGQSTNIFESTRTIRKEATHILNSPLNRTYISDTANTTIKAYPAARYFKDVVVLGAETHFFPTQVQQKSGETDADYYERILQERFDRLKAAVGLELYKLQH